MTGTIKSWLSIQLYNNTIGAYALAFFNLIALVVILLLSKRLLVAQLGRMAKQTTNDFDDFLVGLIRKVGAPVFVAASLYLVTVPLALEPSVRTMIRQIMIVVIAIRSVLLIEDIVRYAISKSYRRAKPDDPAADTVIKNLTYIVRWAIWSLAAVFVLDNLGINISALVAGLGIGGIAVALAAQAVLGDLFSALSIFVDKPFEVGDFIIIDGLMGTVEYVGLKTTRLRSLSGEQLIFSNTDLTKSRIKNYKRMQMRRIAFKIGVVYDTSLEKTRKIPELVKTLFGKLKDVKLDRVHFESFGDFSLNFEIVYYVHSADYNIYMDRQQEINFAVKEAFEREGIEFAYPTQKLYVKQS